VAYRFLPHTADVRVALESDSLPGLLRDGVAVLRVLLVGESPVEERLESSVVLDPGNPEGALLTLLRDILIRYETENFVPAEVRFAGSPSKALEGTLVGEPFDRGRHDPEPEVKAVTRHGLVVHRVGTTWRAEVVFDV